MERRQVTSLQVASVLASTIIGVGVLELPRFVVAVADSGGPIVTLLGALIGLIALLLVGALGRRFPGKSIVESSEAVLGRGLAFIVGLSVIVFFALLTALAAREFGEVVGTTVLRRTPLEVTVIAMLLLAAISARTDIGTFVSMHVFYLPFILAPGLIIVLLSLKNAHLLNLLPLWGNEHHSVLGGCLTVAALFQSSFVLTILIPYMRNPQRVYTSTFLGWGIAILINMMIVVAAIAVFGSEEIKMLMWPTLELAKMTALPANILERLDAAFLAVWVTAVFTTLLSTYYMTIQSIGLLFRMKGHKTFSFFVLPFIFLVAMLPQSVLDLYRIINIVGKGGLVVTALVPAALVVMMLLLNKKEESEQEASNRLVE